MRACNFCAASQPFGRTLAPAIHPPLFQSALELLLVSRFRDWEETGREKRPRFRGVPLLSAPLVTLAPNCFVTRCRLKANTRCSLSNTSVRRRAPDVVASGQCIPVASWPRVRFSSMDMQSSEDDKFVHWVATAWALMLLRG